MKQCRGCGAFFEKKCQYCGYKESESDPVLNGQFSTLIISGDMNRCTVIKNSDIPEITKITGDMQRQNVNSTSFLNIEIYGDMNRVSVNSGINYTVVKTKGDMNRVK